VTYFLRVHNFKNISASVVPECSIGGGRKRREQGNGAFLWLHFRQDLHATRFSLPNRMPCFVPELFAVLSFYEKENRYSALVKRMIPRISARHALF
jgi:hypothetical protein